GDLRGMFDARRFLHGREAPRVGDSDGFEIFNLPSPEPGW
ncbi:26937_t:CDS:1, partial [Dentiscutata erythropus]